MSDKFDYAAMQKKQYDYDARAWNINNKNPVVGSFEAHNNHADYQTYLLKDLDCGSMLALDFGCGPGRNLVRFHSQFKRLDGVDISQVNLDNAKKWLEHNNMWDEAIQLYLCNGTDLSAIPNEAYDLIISTITLQHICVHEIRYGYFEEFFRVLKNGGWISLQMGFGTKVDSRQIADYYDNLYDTTATNGHADTRVENPDQLRNDLEKIGFKNFSHTIRPVGPGDRHPYWIFFRAQKP